MSKGNETKKHDPVGKAGEKVNPFPIKSANPVKAEPVANTPVKAEPVANTPAAAIKADTINPTTGEINEAKHLTVTSPGQSVILPNGRTLTVKKIVTRQQLKFADNESHVVTIDGPIFKGKEIKGAKTIAKVADLMNVLNVMHGNQPMQLIVNAVLRGILEEQYPNVGGTPGPDDGNFKTFVGGTWGYVGKTFSITRFPPNAGKQYPTFEVVEVDVS